MVVRIGHGSNRRRRIYLREWRTYRHLTQQQLADRLDTTKGTISRIENGERDFTGDFLEACADALQCQPADLISRDPAEPQPLDAMLRTAPEAVRKQAVALVAALLATAA